jgi:hypothetical protein
LRLPARWSKDRRASALPVLNGARGRRALMVRKPITVEVVAEGDARYVVLTYPNGDVVRHKVDTESKPKRRPRRPPTRIKTRERRGEDR